jgi:hypothetical protein
LSSEKLPEKRYLTMFVRISLLMHVSVTTLQALICPGEYILIMFKKFPAYLITPLAPIHKYGEQQTIKEGCAPSKIINPPSVAC